MATTMDVPQEGGGNGGVVVDKGAEYFGFVIAYLLPGLVGLWAAAYLSPSVKTWMSEAATHSTSLGGFLFLMVAAVGAGMALHTLRWVAFEVALPKLCSRQFCEDWLLTRPDYNEGRIRDTAVQSALAELRDQHYRYYQCHGGLAIAVPCVYAAWLFSAWESAETYKILWAGGLAFVFAVVSAYAALDAQWRLRHKRLALLKR